MSPYDVDYNDNDEDISITPFEPILFLREWFNYFLECLGICWEFFQNYAWYLIFWGIILYYMHKKLAKPLLESLFGSYEEYKKRRSEKEYSAKYHKNPDLFAARISSQQQAAEKLQEKYKKDAEEYAKKLQEKNEIKIRELVEKAGGSGQRLGNGNTISKSLKPEYNPLMGPGPSTYRAPKRSPCGSGGCGK